MAKATRTNFSANFILSFALAAFELPRSLSFSSNILRMALFFEIATVVAWHRADLSSEFPFFDIFSFT